MRAKLFVLFFLFSGIISSQVKIKNVSNNSFDCEIFIPAVQYKDVKKGKFIERDYVNFNDFDHSGSYKLPSFNFIFAIPLNSKPQITLVNKKLKKYQNIIPALNSHLERINDSTLVEKKVATRILKYKNYLPDFEISDYFFYRDFYCVTVKINSHKFNNRKNELNVIKRITLNFSFPGYGKIKERAPVKNISKFDPFLKDIFADYEIAEQFRITPGVKTFRDTTAEWIDFNKTYFKLSIIKDGIYKLTKDILEEYGLNVNNIDPTTFQVFEGGKEVPIFVYGQSDGSFNSGDYIEFYGHKNYGKISDRIINHDNENYNEYLNRFTDTTYYFLTWGNNKGKRIPEQNLSPSLAHDTLSYYKEFTHYEKNNWTQNLNGDAIANQTPDWHKNKSWYWKWLGNWNSPQSFDFSSQDFIPNKTAKIYFKIVSAGSNIDKNAHQIALYFNNTKLDSQNINRFQQALLSGSVSTNLLSTNNTFKVYDYNNGTMPNFLACDWYEVEYPRELKLRNDSLIFRTPDDITEGLKIIQLRNTNNSDYSIYRIFPNTKKIDSYVLNNGTLFFADTVAPGMIYSIMGKEKLFTPQFVLKRKFLNLRGKSSQTDYLAITNYKFNSAVNNYLNYISSTYKVTTKSVDVQDIFDEFGYGYPTPRAIKNFIRFAFENWESPAFSYLELIGDASYDYKYIKYKNEGVKISFNYVPSRGYPIGDNWYAIWNDSQPPIPQFKVGRLPILTSEQLQYYLDKIKTENNNDFEGWNKRYLFFSGGSKPAESGNMKSSNDYIINNFVSPRPVAGKYTHFYKTYNPNTDLGPYSTEEIQKAIDDGGLFISYLGHSGTATWDNGINSVVQLKNNINRHPLITDFGCSTNKFAEPDILSFGERFLFKEQGQAIAYNGNSSLGIMSTALTAPKYFYEKIISDSLHEIGNASLYTKLKLFEIYGNRGSNKVFALTNCILGDPIFRLKIPNKPNLVLQNTGFVYSENLNDQMDSAQVGVILYNWGKAPADSINLEIQESYKGNLLKSRIIKVLMPEYSDTIYFYLDTKEKPGTHIINVTADPDNKINEIYENDNSAQTSVNVYSLSIRDILPFSYANGVDNSDSLILLMPPKAADKSLNILFQTSVNEDFSNALDSYIKVDSFATKIPLNFSSLGANRLWIRYKQDNAAEFSKPKSITNYPYVFALADSLALNEQKIEHLKFSNGTALSKEKVTISVLSAGAYSGATCTISKNGKNLLGDTFFAGMSIVVFEPTTLEVDTAFGLLLFQKPDNVQKLADYINSIPQGKIVAMGVSNDARNNMSSALRNAIKTLGSTKIDSLVFQGPWALIGEKGAEPGAIIEKVGGKYDPPIVIDTTFTILSPSGNLVTEKIGPASEWDSILVMKTLPKNSNLKFRLFGIHKNNTTDTLGFIKFANNTAIIDSINANTYPYIKINVDFTTGDSGFSPALNSIFVDYKKVPELGTNYQVVSLSSDSVLQNKDIKLYFSVYNAGDDLNDSVSVKTFLLNNNTSKTLLDTFITSLKNFQHTDFYVDYLTNFEDGYGQMKFKIIIDPENKIVEKYKDNNVFEKTFYVVKDTITQINSATINVLFDGERIFDGEYVSTNPKITFSLHYTYGYNYRDTSSVKIYIDNLKVPFSSLNVQKFDTVKKELVFYYKPNLENGQHSLKIEGNNIYNAEDHSNGYFKYFLISNKFQITDVYNYPNPFRTETYFTFRLTQAPDKLNLLIYTIAGRLIKTIEPSVSELHLNFNKIYWDGSDNDGNQVANGTYIYRVIVNKGEKIYAVTGKIARLR